MSNLETYLIDHRAGAVGAIHLLGHLIDHATDAEFGAFCRQLREDVQADVDTLEGLLERMDASQGVVRQAGAWLAE